MEPFDVTCPECDSDVSLNNVLEFRANLSEADFSETDLSEANLSRTVLFDLEISNNAPSYILKAVSLYEKIRNILTVKKTSEEIGKENLNKI